MASLLLTEEIAQTLLGALLTVCRSDGEVTGDELEALRHAAGEIGGNPAVDSEAFLFSHVTPRSFAALVGPGRSMPFRMAGASAPDDIGSEFIRLALKVARADGSLNPSEASAIRAFAEALGVDERELDRLRESLDDAPVAVTIKR